MSFSSNTPSGELFPPLRIEPGAQATQRPGSFTVNGGVLPRRAIYPPVTTSFEVQGYVTDAIKPHDSRDIGRSSVVDGTPFYVFGDTFCKSFDGRDFLGVVSNTSAVVGDDDEPRNPLRSTYVDMDDDDNEGLLKPFIPLSRAERAQERTRTVRICLWSFGGVVTSEVQGNPKYVWFEKTVEQKDSNGATKSATSMGTGLAIVEVDRGSEGLRGRRVFGDDMLFGADEPRVGVFSAVAWNRTFFLWGHRGNDVILARVRDDTPHHKGAYVYWEGSRYVSDFRRAVPVLSGYQQGQIFRSELFGPSKPWVFVGCTSYADSKVMMAAAQNIEGPWENMTAVCTAAGINVPDGLMYCVYPHPWVYGGHTGELFVTWSEQWPGGVIGAKLQFQTEPEVHWKEIDLQNLPDNIVEWAEECNEMKQLAALKGVQMNFTRTPLLGRASLHIQGGDDTLVQEAQFEVCRLLTRRMSATAVRIPASLPPPVAQQPQQIR